MDMMYDDGKNMMKVFRSKAYHEYRSRSIGDIGVNEGGGGFIYEGFTVRDDSSYFIPAEITEEQILEAIEKSLKDGHDYLYDLVAKPENKVVYKPGCYY